jgi:hypothetical protein
VISALMLAELGGFAVAPSAGLAAVALVTRSLAPARGRHCVRQPPPSHQQIMQPQFALAAPVAELPPAAESRADRAPTPGVQQEGQHASAPWPG